MMQDTTALRAELIETARGMNLRGINVNKSGNVSARACRADGAEGFLITPTGMPYESLTPDDLVWIPLVNPPSLRNADGARRPSSEWEMHARVYLRRSDIDAVVHTHSCFATALACQDMPIPPFHYMVAAAGGHSIDVAPYATFGTPELARVAAEALAVKNACLLSHHGVLAAGKSLQAALTLAVEVENLAHQYVVVCQLGKPKRISYEEMHEVLRSFRTYGQQSVEGESK